MQTIFEMYKPLIRDHWAQLRDLATNNVAFSNDVSQRLFAFGSRGKMVRGSIFLYTVDLFSTHTADHIGIATIIELLHTALLIHDDIIDHDLLRRGQASMHAQYEALGRHKKVPDPSEFGKGMALCVGDIAIFGAFYYLSQIKLAAHIHQKITEIITKEFLTVGFGELHDIALGYFPTVPTSQEVLAMYLRKTARYTFSLPFILGCQATEQSEETTKNFEILGEKLGMIFQLKDDHLSLFEETQTTGKQKGNDISENKNTIYKVLLFERMREDDKKLATTIFGKNKLTTEEIQTILNLMQVYNVVEDVNKQIDVLVLESKELIIKLPLDQDKKDQFNQLIEFLIHRHA